VHTGADRIVISPGPGRPEQAGVTMRVIRELATRRRFWACAWAIRRSAPYSAAKVVRAGVPMHGKTSTIEHNGRGLFSGITGPFVASRYHSLIVAEKGLPSELEVTARTREDAHIMGCATARGRFHGVQFHPESILTGEGKHIRAIFSTGRCLDGADIVSTGRCLDRTRCPAQPDPEREARRSRRETPGHFFSAVSPVSA